MDADEEFFCICVHLRVAGKSELGCEVLPNQGVLLQSLAEAPTLSPNINLRKIQPEWFLFYQHTE